MGRKKKMTPLVAMAIYARQNGISYGQVQGLVGSGKLTYEQLGVEEPKGTKDAPIKLSYEPIEMKRCPVCGTEFEPNKSYRRYCSTRCQERTKYGKWAAVRVKRRTEDKKEQPADSMPREEPIRPAE